MGEDFFNKILGENHSKELEELIASQFIDSLMDLHKEDKNTYSSINGLSEEDFYPPEDSRKLSSGIEDIDLTNNFEQFTSEFFELCEHEDFFSS